MQSHQSGNQYKNSRTTLFVLVIVILILHISGCRVSDSNQPEVTGMGERPNIQDQTYTVKPSKIVFPTQTLTPKPTEMIIETPERIVSTLRELKSSSNSANGTGVSAI